jgi:hypothetical protein
LAFATADKKNFRRQEIVNQKETCRINHAGLLLDFRVREGKLERRLLEADETPIDNGLGVWKETSVDYVSAMKDQIPQLNEWLSFALAKR